ncbi:hypothetical protein GCM10009775_14790 [Microbacterium aoyamense]|uniref:EccD-like transmembrane domain-containing protein n=1 Tax=Microbacterium aoyamense TaxID=344166 RepID=A0ABP5AVC5_9MICO|nr:EsaB/YukD family protein [Microbacterium aoyamense]
MSDYTRLTVVGASRRADVVVASDDPLGVALPRLIDLLGETSGTVSRPLTLVAPDGDQLDIGRSPVQQGLVDGTIVRLVRLDAAPPPPVVIDVTDAAADAHDERTDRWDSTARTVAGCTGIALAVAVAGFLAPFGGSIAAAVALLIAFGALLAVATGLGLGGLRAVAGTIAAAAAGLAIPLAVASSTAYAQVHADAALLTGAAVLVAAESTVVLLCLGVARRRTGAAAGGALGAVLGTLLGVMLVAGMDATAAAAIAGTVAAFATGPLPWIALSAAGLTDLDQRVGAGERVARSEARTSIDDAYAALTWSVAAVAAVLGITGVALVLDGGLWPGLLALAFGLVAALRSRAFPLRAQGWVLWAVVVAIAAAAVVRYLSGAYGWVGAAVALGAAVVVAVMVLVSPRPHVRARLRGFGNVLETLAVVALLPVLLGALGVYDELLGMFGGGS